MRWIGVVVVVAVVVPLCDVVATELVAIALLPPEVLFSGADPMTLETVAFSMVSTPPSTTLLNVSSTFVLYPLQALHL